MQVYGLPAHLHRCHRAPRHVQLHLRPHPFQYLSLHPESYTIWRFLMKSLRFRKDTPPQQAHPSSSANPEDKIPQGDEKEPIEVEREVVLSI